jgi:hypothetical protein
MNFYKSDIFSHMRDVDETLIQPVEIQRKLKILFLISYLLYLLPEKVIRHNPNTINDFHADTVNSNCCKYCVGERLVPHNQLCTFIQYKITLSILMLKNSLLQ